MHWSELAIRYLQLGFTHVLPAGADHIVFILCLYLPAPSFKEALIRCSIFTLAHSCSLALAASGYIPRHPAVTEPLIALSIAITAIQNIVKEESGGNQWLLIGLFGFLHGMGFAGALLDSGIAATGFIPSLLFFNLGVEAAQLTVILLAYLLVVKWCNEKPWYKKRVLYPFSILAAILAMWWVVTRIIE